MKLLIVRRSKIEMIAPDWIFVRFRISATTFPSTWSDKKQTKSNPKRYLVYNTRAPGIRKSNPHLNGSTKQNNASMGGSQNRARPHDACIWQEYKNTAAVRCQNSKIKTSYEYTWRLVHYMEGSHLNKSTNNRAALRSQNQKKKNDIRVYLAGTCCIEGFHLNKSTNKQSRSSIARFQSKNAIRVYLAPGIWKAFHLSESTQT